ncbi:hypothetical protein GQR58_013296 [Nymphon striatum]|nr:hypothetical protein GQR58_013296 [Nymphon striatum]
MNSTNLAMMFAPHIMCPRWVSTPFLEFDTFLSFFEANVDSGLFLIIFQLSGEELQAASANITKAVALMIEYAPDLFKVPKELYLDVAAYWKDQQKENSKQSNYKALKAKFGLDSPESNGVMINTKLAFCDRTLVNESSEKDSTTMAVAGLYAYVHSMPDCPQKRKLIKQFNKENGYGVDLEHPPVRNKHKRSKTVGDPIQDCETSTDSKDCFASLRTPFDSDLKSNKRKINNEENVPPEDSWDLSVPQKARKIESSGPVFSKYSSPFARSVIRASKRMKVYTCTPSTSVHNSKNIQSSIQTNPLESIKSESTTPAIGKYSSPLARSVIRASKRMKIYPCTTSPSVNNSKNLQSGIQSNQLESIKSESATPAIGKYSSPLARSVIRASKRMKMYTCTTSPSVNNSKNLQSGIQSNQLESIKRLIPQLQSTHPMNSCSNSLITPGLVLPTSRSMVFGMKPLNPGEISKHAKFGAFIMKLNNSAAYFWIVHHGDMSKFAKFHACIIKMNDIGR